MTAESSRTFRAHRDLIDGFLVGLSALAISAMSAACSLGAGAGAGATTASTSATGLSASRQSSETTEIRLGTKDESRRKYRKTSGKSLPSWETTIDTRFAASGGTMNGRGPLVVDAPVAEIAGSMKARVDHSRYRVEMPLSVSHRETQGVSLSESKVATGLELQYRPSRRFRIASSAKVAGTWRPDWPDLYQPLGDGELAGSDRKSFWRREAGLEVYGRPIGRHRTRARYDYAIIDYRQDPTFDAIEDPNHLVPSDHRRHRASLSWAYWARDWKLGASVDMFRKDYDFAYARDAGTGRTNATSETPNPLQTLRGAEPALELEIELWDDRVELELGYGFEIVEDVFQGYYSYTGHHPTVSLEVEPWTGWTLDMRGDLKWRRYGPGSYAEGPSHPALRFGDRRVDRKFSADLRLSRQITEQWNVFTAWELDVRRTNFPDYVPGVFPSRSEFDIAWSYDNWQVQAGVAFRR